MSHISKVKVELKNLDALERALLPLNLELVRNQKTFRAYRQGNPCEHLIRSTTNEKAYEIGVVQNQDGTYALAWDTFLGGRGMVELAGKDCCNIMQNYAVEEAQTQMESAGYVVERTHQENGTVQLQCLGM